jgi:hypothetical protein
VPATVVDHVSGEAPKATIGPFAVPCVIVTYPEFVIEQVYVVAAAALFNGEYSPKYEHVLKSTEPEVGAVAEPN